MKGFKLEVYETDGTSYLWWGDSTEELFNDLKLYYGDEELLEKVEKIEIYPLTNEE